MRTSGSKDCVVGKGAAISPSWCACNGEAGPGAPAVTTQCHPQACAAAGAFGTKGRGEFQERPKALQQGGTPGSWWQIRTQTAGELSPFCNRWGHMAESIGSPGERQWGGGRPVSSSEGRGEDVFRFWKSLPPGRRVLCWSRLGSGDPS